MGMFSKIVAFLDKAAGVPTWVTHAENIRKLEKRGCPSLYRAIVENEILWPLASYSLEEMLPQLAGMITIGKVVADNNNINSNGLRQLVHEVISVVEGPIEGPLQVLYDFVGKDALPTIEIVEEEEEGPEQTLSPTTAPDLDNLEKDAIPLDEAAKAQLLQGMMAVISRGRKPAPTLKVLNNMSMGDKGLIIEALSAMEARGNSLAKVILEDPSL